MAEITGIEWCDHSFNPWIGCTRLSPACDHCYAESLARRYGWAEWGPGQPRRQTSASTWAQPWRWQRAAKQAGVRRKVFCASLADVFDAEVDDDWRVTLFALIEATDALDWLLLTKRPQVARKFFATRPVPGNVWLGTTVENQAMADLRIPPLLEIPAKVRFLSCEPLLGPVDLRNVRERLSGQSFMTFDALAHPDTLNRGRCRQGIDWVIAGGESGPKARPSHPGWFRALRDQCQAAGAPFFFKQWGEYGTGFTHLGTGAPVFKRFISFQQWVDKAASWVNGGVCLDSAGFILNNGSDFARARDEGRFPVTIMHRLGKVAAGALLDGREWREFPT